MLYNNIKFDNKCIFYMSTCCTSFENLGILKKRKFGSHKFSIKSIALFLVKTASVQFRIPHNMK